MCVGRVAELRIPRKVDSEGSHGIVELRIVDRTRSLCSSFLELFVSASPFEERWEQILNGQSVNALKLKRKTRTPISLQFSCSQRTPSSVKGSTTSFHLGYRRNFLHCSGLQSLFRSKNLDRSMIHSDFGRHSSMPSRELANAAADDLLSDSC